MITERKAQTDFIAPLSPSFYCRMPDSNLTKMNGFQVGRASASAYSPYCLNFSSVATPSGGGI
jgi:hypothetical protein